MKKKAAWLPVGLLLMALTVSAQKPKPPVAEPPAASPTTLTESGQLSDPFKQPVKTDTSTQKEKTLDELLTELKNWGSSAKEITVGSQTWSTENLNTGTFRNGDAIIEAKTESEWQVAYAEKKPAWSYYNNDPSNAAKYGRLYNYYAVIDPRGLAPSGWHIPTKEEWEKLITALPTDAETMRKVRGTAKGDYGFVMGGYRTEWEFKNIELIGEWWTCSKTRITGSYGSSVSTGCYVYSLSKSYDKFTQSQYSTQGVSVRCVKD